MDSSEYMLAAYQHDFREVKMTEGDLAFLTQQVLKLDYKGYIKDHFSVYKIYSEIKKAGSSMAYKNVHQKVHKILSLGLIEEVGTGYVLHGARYYQISPNGWLNLILTSEDPWIKHAIKKYYNKNIIFKTFLYPYFELETIMFSLDYVELCTYLRNCCHTTIQTMKRWESYPDSVFHLSREKLRGLSVEDLRQAIEEELEQERTDEQNSNDITWALVEQMMTTHGWVPMGTWSPKSICGALDLHIRSFLFQQITRASHIPFLESFLSKDRKFMAAVEEIQEEFR
jgi:hypothetical protein